MRSRRTTRTGTRSARTTTSFCAATAAAVAATPTQTTMATGAREQRPEKHIVRAELQLTSSIRIPTQRGSNKRQAAVMPLLPPRHPQQAPHSSEPSSTQVVSFHEATDDMCRVEAKGTPPEESHHGARSLSVRSVSHVPDDKLPRTAAHRTRKVPPVQQEEAHNTNDNNRPTTFLFLPTSFSTQKRAQCRDCLYRVKTCSSWPALAAGSAAHTFCRQCNP